MEQYDDIPLLKTCLFRILCLRDSQMNLFWRSNLDCSESPSHIGRFLHDYCGNQAGRNAGRKRWSFPYLPDARLPEVADRLIDWPVSPQITLYPSSCTKVAVSSSMSYRHYFRHHQWQKCFDLAVAQKKQLKVRPALKFNGIFIDFLLSSFLISLCLVQESEPLEFLSHENPQTIEVC